MANKVDQQVIDQFRRASFLMDRLTYDNTISPGTGGSTLTYGYIQLKTPSTAGVRAINSEYTANEAKRQEKTAKAVILGGSFEVDRVIANTSGAVDEIQFQLNQKILAGRNYFHNLVINGTSASSGAGYVPNTFDGLKKTLTGSDTEFTSAVDLSTSAMMDANYNAFLDELDSFLGELDGTPDMLLMNNKMLTKLRSIARRAGYWAQLRDEFGRVVDTYNGIPMLDLGKYYNGSGTVDVVDTSAPSTSAFGMTSIYAVCLGLDAFHGITVTGDNIVHTYLPDLTAPGAVKTGEVEMIAGVVLKNTRKAGVLKGIAVDPQTGE